MQTVPKDRIVPIYRDETAGHFISLEKMDAIPVKIDDMVLFTAPLIFGNQFSLLGISDHPRLSTTSDYIEPPVSLDAIYITIDSQIVVLDVTQNSTSQGVPSVNGNPRDLEFDLRIPSVVIDSTTRDVAGNPLRRFAEDPELTVDLKVDVTGLLNVETSNAIFNCIASATHNDAGIIAIPEGVIINATRNNINMLPVEE